MAIISERLVFGHSPRSLAAEGRVYDIGGAAHVHGVTLSGNSALTIGSGGHNDDEGDAIRLRDEAFGETGAVSLASERRDNGDGGVLQLPDRGLDGGLDGSSVLSLGSGEHTDEEGDEVRVRGSAVGGTRVSSLGSGLRVNDKDGVARVLVFRHSAQGGVTTMWAVLYSCGTIPSAGLVVRFSALRGATFMCDAVRVWGDAFDGIRVLSPDSGEQYVDEGCEALVLNDAPGGPSVSPCLEKSVDIEDK